MQHGFSSLIFRRVLGFAVALAGVLHVGACSSDLDDCDPAAAEEVVYGRGGLIATKGQALMHDSCGNAAFCHSNGASGDSRYGVPHGLDFDMLPSPSGWRTVREHEEDVWEAVLDDNMPPAGVGKKVQGDGDWRFDPNRSASSEKLPALSSAAGKAALRNWLACGAPVVNDTRIPDWAVGPGGGDDEDGGSLFGDGGSLAPTAWGTIYTTVFQSSCAIAGCHNEAAAGGLVMTDACTAYDNLLKAGSCGKPRLVPGDEKSVLLDKLGSDDPSCGDLRMPPPPLAPLPNETLRAIRDWVKNGAEAPACK